MKIALFGKAFGSDYDELMIDVLKILKTSSIDIVVYETVLKMMMIIRFSVTRKR